jgi:hypothetical protein
MAADHYVESGRDDFAVQVEHERGDAEASSTAGRASRSAMSFGTLNPAASVAANTSLSTPVISRTAGSSRRHRRSRSTCWWYQEQQTDLKI